MEFSFFLSKKNKKNENYYLRLKTEKKETSYNADNDIGIETRDGVTFNSYYEIDNAITVYFLLLVDFLNLQKNSIIFCDIIDSPTLKF